MSPSFPVCRAVVHIQVNDVNEFAPVFREAQYRAAVTEGKIYDSILQVEATDQDCSPQYSQICNYQITTTRTPFAIDRNGESTNVGKLVHDILREAASCGCEFQKTGACRRVEKSAWKMGVVPKLTPEEHHV